MDSLQSMHFDPTDGKVRGAGRAQSESSESRVEKGRGCKQEGYTNSTTSKNANSNDRWIGVVHCGTCPTPFARCWFVATLSNLIWGCLLRQNPSKTSPTSLYLPMLFCTDFDPDFPRPRDHEDTSKNRHSHTVPALTIEGRYPQAVVCTDRPLTHTSTHNREP